MTTQSSNKDVFLNGFLKLLKKEWEPDVKLKAQDTDETASSSISAHKLVLAARSNVFEQMLESDEFKTSDKIATITLWDMEHEELEAFVEFMYSADGSISSRSLRKHAHSLYQAADKYEIPHLRDLCRTQLISSLIKWNAISIFELAQIPFDKALNDAAFATIKTEIRYIAHYDEFKEFVVNHPNLVVEIMKDSLNQPIRGHSSCVSHGYSFDD